MPHSVTGHHVRVDRQSAGLSVCMREAGEAIYPGAEAEHCGDGPGVTGTLRGVCSL